MVKKWAWLSAKIFHVACTFAPPFEISAYRPADRIYVPAAYRRFLAFCTHFSISSTFPLTENLLCYFTAYLADEGLAPQTGKAYLSALRYLKITLGFPDPRGQSPMPILKSRRREVQAAQRKRLPSLPSMGDTLMAFSNPVKCVMWAVACTACIRFFPARGAPPRVCSRVQPVYQPRMWGYGHRQPHT